MLGWVIYFLGKPRIADPVPRRRSPQPAQVAAGSPVYPAGEPYCAVHQLIYPFGATRCDVDGATSRSICPKCSTGRPAHIATCGNCGLVLKIDRAVPALRPSGPPPGGAAAA